MSRYYLAQVVTEEEYGQLDIGKEFGTGVIVDGIAGEDDDLVIITVHEQEDGEYEQAEANHKRFGD